MTAVSSDTSVLSATAGSLAVEGTYDVQVTALAKAQVVQSSGFTSSDDPRGIAATLTLNGQSIDVTATDSLTTIAAKINTTDDVDARASVLQTGATEYKLIITSTVSGAAGTMTFGGDVNAWKTLGVIEPDDTPNEVVAASDAAFTVNGVVFVRSTNSVTDAIPGLTLNLLEATDPVSGEGGKTILTVDYDSQSIVDALKSFVTEYNKLIDTVGTYTTWDADKRQAGPLFGDSLISRLLSEVKMAVFKEVGGTTATYNSMRTLGLSTGTASTFSKQGKLTFDETKLNAALETDRDSVAVVFGAKTANVALSSLGSTASASSTLSAQYLPSTAVNGDVTSVLWGAGGGWSDGTAANFADDWLEVDFGQARTIDKVNVYTVNSTAYPAGSYGLRDFALKYWNGSSWADLGAAVSGNMAGMRSISFTAVTIQKVRLYATASNDGQYARVVEMEAYEQNDGALARLEAIVDNYASAGGFVPSRLSQLAKEDAYLADRIEDMQDRLDQRMAALRKRFTDMEVALQRLNSQSLWLTQQVQALSTTE
jgi:flagellar capping protein FliD